MNNGKRPSAAVITIAIFSLLFLVSGCFDSGAAIKTFLKEIDGIGNGYDQSQEEDPPEVGSSHDCYVSDYGNDFSDGTQPQPVKTLAQAARILRAKNVEEKNILLLSNLTSPSAETIDNTGSTKITISASGGSFSCAATLTIGAGSTVEITGSAAFASLTVNGNLTLSGTHTIPMTIRLASGKKITPDGFSNSSHVTLIPSVYNAGIEVLTAASNDFKVQNQSLNGNTIVWKINSCKLEPEAKYYVSATGADTNDGLSDLTAFKTLRRAMAMIVSIQGADSPTIIVSGTLNYASEGAAGGGTDSVFLINTNFAKDITIKGESGGTLSASGTSYKRVVHVKRGKILFESITISGGNGVTEGAGIYIENPNSVVDISGCIFSSNTTTSGTPESGKDIFKKEGKLTVSGGQPLTPGVHTSPCNIYVVI